MRDEHVDVVCGVEPDLFHVLIAANEADKASEVGSPANTKKQRPVPFPSTFHIIAGEYMVEETELDPKSIPVYVSKGTVRSGTKKCQKRNPERTELHREPLHRCTSHPHQFNLPSLSPYPFRRNTSREQDG